MSNRMNLLALGALGGAALAATVACSKAPGTEERKTEMTTQTSQGEVKTTSQSTQAGNTLEAKAETKADTPAGTVKAETETIVGTVTVYEPGKKIEVMTAEKKMHAFTLDTKDTVVSVDPGVVVGSRVKLTEQTGDNKTRRVTVKLES